MPTQIVLSLSTFTSEYWWVIAGLLVALLLTGQAALQTDAGRLAWDRSKLRVPVLVLNGEKDLQVDPKQNLPVMETALKASGNPHARVRQMPGLNHLFQRCDTGNPGEYGTIEETINDAALKEISAWIAALATR